DFVTVVGRGGQHAACVRALLAELELERQALAPELETVFLGGGTPTFTEASQLERLLAALPDAAEVTVEANPETVTPELAALLRRNRVDRVSLGAQSFEPRLLAVLDRVAGPDDVRRAFYHLRDADFDNVSLDLIYWLAHDYLGVGVGAVSTIENRRWRNAPSVRGYVAALAAGLPPPRELEELSAEVRETERVMLGLRLDEPVRVTAGSAQLDRH